MMTTNLRHLVRPWTYLTTAALCIATALPAQAAMDQPAAVVENLELRVNAWPGRSFAIGEALEYLGFRRFRLYDVSDAEIHVFAEQGEGAAVTRLLWVQLEQVLDSSEHVYDYSDLPLRFDIAGLSFVADTRFGPGYTLESVDSEGDVAEVLRLLAEHGLRTPAEMMRLRMVTVDESGRREMLAIYLEDLRLGNCQSPN